VSWGKSRHAQACLSGSRVMWRGPGGARRVLTHTSVATGWSAIEELVKADAVNVLSVWLFGGLCRASIATPVSGTRGRREAEQAIAAALRANGVARAHELVFLSDRHSGVSPVPVALVDASAIDMMPDWRAQKIRLAHLKPWWSAIARIGQPIPVAKRSLDGSTLLALFDGEWLNSYLFGSDGLVFDATSSGPITAVDDARRVVLRNLALDPKALARCVWLTAGTSEPAQRRGTETFAFADQVTVGDSF
jgi:hypothetical protein